MERIKNKIAVFLEALATLHEGISLFDKYEDIFSRKATLENEQLFKAMRDSAIQRFEYCADLFWKIVKIYLEDIEKIHLSINSPRAILREAVIARLLSELEGDECIDMVEARNKTSHTYQEVMAEEIVHEVPQYYELMKIITERVQGNIEKK